MGLLEASCTHISLAMKVFKLLILPYLQACVSPLLNFHRFAYQTNRSVKDAINLADHFTLNLFTMPQVMGVKAVLHHWILDFLRTRVQTVKSQRHVMPIDVNTGALQGCVLSSLLLSNYTNNLRSHHHSVKFFKFFMQMTPPSSA